MRKFVRLLGALGAVVSLIIFVRDPSWPTPDKILVFLTFVFMALGQATEMLKRLVPFVGLLLVYESFRGVAESLNKRVEFHFMINFDKFVFRRLPTAQLQQWLWHGHVMWYDFIFYLAYMLHFILPISLAILIWKTRDAHYWRFVTTYLVVSFMGFLTFLAFPAAPPWMASDQGLIAPIVRISSQVWASLGIHDFPSVYNKISPNAVAAVPSLHAAYSTLFAIFVIKLYGKKWGLLACVFPLLIYVGTIYQGEHYAFDAIIGIMYAIFAYFIAPWVLNQVKRLYTITKSRFQPVKSAS